jgi:hypothetical protein
MNDEERRAICQTCVNRSFDPKYGLICGLTGRRPDFVESCKSYVEDEVEIHKVNQREFEEQNENGFGINARIVGGVALICFSLVALIVTEGGYFFYGALIVGGSMVVRSLNLNN